MDGGPKFESMNHPGWRKAKDIIFGTNMGVCILEDTPSGILCFLLAKCTLFVVYMIS
jgi:hypothetical protein